ncbi:DUF3082 domain-containing protein [Phormidesmis priestleyi ULC007]|uniref:DUF3082 domain-containing protein n=2 Tax=Phormidesmis priestleyi TaxID=268141 RepID=A0A2T1DNY5_9CYAN|nr:DUF3082 domain-containing protein [Phormidesmis priestleyi ULC007]PZO52568.1 MAG: DUF3082 domain-containing protein [Phormidesmis priestleyi]
MPESSSESSQSKTRSNAMPSPLQCVLGSLVAGGIALVLYNMTQSIALAFANRPLQYHNVTTINIAVAVRTLVVGLSALGTGIFGLAAVGLFGLGIQVLIGQVKQRSTVD